MRSLKVHGVYLSPLVSTSSDETEHSVLANADRSGNCSSHTGDITATCNAGHQVGYLSAKPAVRTLGGNLSMVWRGHEQKID